MIKVENLTVKYKQLVAVDNISFDVKKGEIFGIIGPNGAGKTSTIECIEGLRKPFGGTISVLGIDPAKERKKLYAHIGVQLQEASFPDSIKVSEICEMFSSFYADPVPYDGLLEKFDLADKKKDFVKKLSGGQKQKLSIIIALIANPKIVFLDELTTGLDPKARIGMWAMIRQLRDEGRTVFLTTHYMEEAEYLCDRVCMMVNGKIAAMNSVPQLIEQLHMEHRITFKAIDADTKTLERIAGVKKVSRINGKTEILGKGKNLLKDVVVFLSENNISFDDLTYTKPSLEDVFLHMTGYRMGEPQ